MTYTFITSFGAALFHKLAPGWRNDDLALYCDAIGQMWDPVYVLANDLGVDDGIASYIPGYGTLFDPSSPLCDFQYLGQFVGTLIPDGTDPVRAALLIIDKCASKRGTYNSIRWAVARWLSGVGTNRVPNPSFEYDTIGAVPFGWVVTQSNTTNTLFHVERGWADTGVNSLHFVSTFATHSNAFAGATTPTGTSGIPVQEGHTYSGSAQVNFISEPTFVSPRLGMGFGVDWFDAAGALLSHQSGDGGSYVTPFNQGGTDLHILPFTGFVAPANAAFAAVNIEYISSGAGTLEFYLDSVVFEESATLPTYVDGDTPGYQWQATPGESSSLTTNPSPATFTILERTQPNGTSFGAYQFCVLVDPSTVINQANLIAAVNSVKPGGVFWSLNSLVGPGTIGTPAWTWNQATGTWSAETMTWDQTSFIQP